MRSALVVLLACGCGRINFDPRDDAGGGLGVDGLDLGACRAIDYVELRAIASEKPGLALGRESVVLGTQTLGNYELINVTASGGTPHVVGPSTGAAWSKLIATDAGFLAVWSDVDVIHLRTTDLDLQPVGADITFGPGSSVAAARNGNEIALVWLDSMMRLWFQRLDLLGTPLGSSVEIVPGFTPFLGLNLVPYQSGYALMIRKIDTTQSGQLARLSATGDLLSVIPIFGPATGNGVDVESIGDQNVVIWERAGEVRVAVVRADRAVEPAVVIEPAAGASTRVTVSWTGDRLAATVITSSNLMSLRYTLHWLDAAAAPIAPPEDLLTLTLPAGETSASVGVPASIGAPGRVAAATHYASTPSTPRRVTVHQRCY